MKRDITTYTDTELYHELRDASARREEAFAEFYARYSGRVYLYCRRILGENNLADDMFQETFLRFLHSCKEDKEMSNVPAFLLRIARNLCLNANRSRKRQTIEFEEFRHPVHDSPYEKQELARLIAMSLDLLSAEYREVFVLQEYNGFTYAEIAEILDVPLSTVRNRAVRAKKKIQKILAPYLDDLQQ